MVTLSLARRESLRFAVFQACDEVFSCVKSYDDPSDVWPTILDVVYSALQERCRLYTVTNSSAARLPTELLGAIFALLDFRDRITTSHVCTSWREASLAQSALLWSDMPDQRHPHHLAQLLERAGSAPVTIVRLRVNDRNVQDLSAVLASHLHRIRVLGLVVHVGHLAYNVALGADAVSSALRPALESVAPLLEEFSAVDIEGQGLACGGIALFKGGAPRLRALTLYGVNQGIPSFLHPVFSHVRALRLGSQNYPISVRDLTSTLALPALELLTLQVGNPLMNMDEGVRVEPGSALQRIMLSTHRDGPICVFNHVAHERIPRIDVFYRFSRPDNDELACALALLSPDENAHVDIVRVAAEGGTLCARLDGRRAYHYLALSSLPVLVGHAFGSLHSLNICISVINCLAGEVHLPALRTLVISMDADVLSDGWKLVCGALASVSFVVASDAFRARHVRALLEDGIRRPRRLEELRFHWAFSDLDELRDLAQWVGVVNEPGPDVSWLVADMLEFE